MIKIFNRQISLKELFFITIIPFGSLFISIGLYIKLQSILIFLACFFTVIKKENSIIIKNNIFSFTSLFFFGLGSIIGLCYVAFGDNDVYKYIEYSFLTFSTYVGFRYGYIKSQGDIVSFIFFIFFSVVILFIPMFFSGKFYRSSIGVSNLFPVIMLFILCPQFRISSFLKTVALALFLLQILCIILSGMRSSVGNAVLVSVILLIYLLFDRRMQLGFVLMKRISLFLFCIICIFFIIPSNLMHSIDNKLNSVYNRFSVTIFNDEKIKIDTNDEKGRVIQAQSLLKAIEHKNGNNILILGYGHGFTFFDEMSYKEKAHSHITWTAYYARYGILGVILYIIMFCFVLYKLILLFFMNRNNYNIFSFALWLSVLQIFLTSLIAGSLISIINWIIIGMAVSFDTYKRII